MRSLFITILILFSFGILSAENFAWSYYNTWCMGDSSQWNTGSSYYCPTKIFWQRACKDADGNVLVDYVVWFHERDLIRKLNDSETDTCEPYLSCSGEWIANGGGTNDSLNYLYNGQKNPQSGYDKWIQRGSFPEFRDSCHANGVKVLMELQAVTASVGWNWVAKDSSRTQKFVNAVARYITDWEFDGCDVNVEAGDSSTSDERTRFYRLLRQAIGSEKLITSVPPPTWWAKYDVEAIGYHDFILPQFYGPTSVWGEETYCTPDGKNVTFLRTVLNKLPSPPDVQTHDIDDWGPNQWYSAGWPKSKIVILFSNEVDLYRGVDSLFACLSYSKTFWPDTGWRYAETNGGTLHWDSDHCGAWMGGTAIDTMTFRGISVVQGQKFYLTMLDTRQVDSIYAWGQFYGYNNYGLYDVSTGTTINRLRPCMWLDYLTSILNSGTPPEEPPEEPPETKNYLLWRYSE